MGICTKNLHEKADFIVAEKEMLKYVRYSIVQIIFIAPLGLGMSIFFIGAAFHEILSGRSIFAFFLALFIGLLFVAAVFVPLIDYREMINFLKNNNIYAEAVFDFSSAIPFLNDRIRLGNRYIFGRNFCVVLRYSDIHRIYQYVRRVHLTERNRELHAVDNSGKVWSLCKLKVHSEFLPMKNKISDKELIEVLSFMLYKNRKIVIGHQS